ncbi:MAG: hypothetical protein FWC20_06235 [Oscillospiraceae bacterium]|nr:hypothetical protein [Oscillospiraceae bacterium]MCL2278991.1 hypothetical protein [Oscillospiraceae bacterium]
MQSSKVFLSLLMRFPIFLGIHSGSVVMHREFYGLTALLIFIPFLLLSLTDEIFSDRRITVVLSIITGVLALLLGQTMVVILVFCMLAFRPDMFDRPESFSKNYFIFWIVVQVLLAYFSPPGYTHIILISLFITAILMLICLQAARLSVFLHSYYARSSSAKTSSHVKSRNKKLLLLFAVVVAGVSILVATTIEFPEVELELQGENLPLVGYGGDTEMEPEVGEVDVLVEAEATPMEFLHIEYEQNGYQVVLTVIGMIITVIFLVFAFFAVRAVFKRLWLRTSKDDFDDVIEVEAAAPEHRERKRKKQRISSVNQTVRRLFVKKVFEYKALGLTPARHDTPRHLSEIISETEDVSALDKLYHKARYSGNNVSAGELSNYHKKRRRR